MSRVSGRFVILTHDHPFLHWDLMLECNGVLRTWRLLEEPAPDSIIAAEPLGDHRLEYLDYEGPVSGERGHVTRWDTGEYTSADVPAHCVQCHISGQRLTGMMRLECDKSGVWTCSFSRRRRAP